MPILFIRVCLFCLFAIGFSTANADVVLQADFAKVEEGGNVLIDVLANDSKPASGFNIDSMYIESEAGKGYLDIDSAGRISYTHYGGPAATDTLSYVISDNEGNEGSPAVVTIQIGAGGAADVGVKVVVPTNPAPVNSTRVASKSFMPSLSALPAVVGNGGRLQAFHRSGQTFITWQESGPSDQYHVYRHRVPITTDNLSSASKLTARWGALGSDTSVNKYAGQSAPEHFVINDLAAALADDTGLFVYTTKASDSASAFYAVTSVRGGVEYVRSLISIDQPVQESVAAPADVLTLVSNGGMGRLYTQFMDYSRWNPTFNGYAYNYAVALPANYNPALSYPLMVELHAYGEGMKFVPQAEYGWPVIQLFPSDPGASVGAINSWWYGYATDHDYRVDLSVPSSGYVANYTEQRVMRAIKAQVQSLPVNTDLIYGVGNSMGASGVLALAIRYGSVFTGVYANEPMTNYATDAVFAQEFTRLWGSKARNLPVVNGGWQSSAIGNVQLGVWDWMNHQKQLVVRRGSDIAFLMTMHGKQDNIIQWSTQGKPFVQALNNAATGFTAAYQNVGHTWVGFVSAIESLFGFGYDDNFPYRYPRSMSFPGIQYATGSAAVIPTGSGADNYNLNIEWATPHTQFAAPIVDTPARYEISLRSTESKQTADITPRRTQQFKLRSGQRCRYQTKGAGKGISGVVAADKDGLITVKKVPIVSGSGTRLIVDCR